MASMRRVFRIAIGLAVLILLAPALYYYGSTWIRGPVRVDVEHVFPIGNKGTLEAKLAYENGEVHRVLNRDQVILFWKIDSEGVDNDLSTALKEGRKVEAWISGLYMPIFGDRSLFNHMNVLAVDRTLPPGIVPLLTYAIALAALLLWLRRVTRWVGARARSLTGSSPSEESSSQ